MQVSEGFKWTVLIILVVGLFTIFLGPAIYFDATATHSERMCVDYNREVEQHAAAMTACYNDPFCRMGDADYAEHERLTTALHRVCAGLPSIPPQPLFVPNQPFPFAVPPQILVPPTAEPGTIARNRAWCPPGSLPTTHGACVRV